MLSFSLQSYRGVGEQGGGEYWTFRISLNAGRSLQPSHHPTRSTLPLLPSRQLRAPHRIFRPPVRFTMTTLLVARENSLVIQGFSAIYFQTFVSIGSARYEDVSSEYLHADAKRDTVSCVRYALCQVSFCITSEIRAVLCWSESVNEAGAVALQVDDSRE